MQQLSLPPRLALRTTDGLAQSTHGSIRLTRYLRLLSVVACAALLVNGCLLEKMRIDPNVDPGAGGERAEGGAPSNGGVPGGDAQAGQAGASEAAGQAGADSVPPGEPGGVSGMNGDGGKSEGGARGGGTTAGEAGQASGSAGAPLAGAGGGGSDDCLYTESSDLQNDYAFGTPEETGLTTAGAVTICGAIEVSHYESLTEKIDIDSYYIDVPSPQTVLVTLQYEDMPSYLVELEVDGQGEAASQRRASMAVADTSIFLELGAGRTRLAVRAHFRDQPPLPAWHYRLRVRPYDLQQHCPRASEATAARAFVESKDGATNTGNDVYRVVRASELSSSTTSATDKAEQIVFYPGIEIGKNYSISGVAGAVTQSDDYADGDYYQINAAEADQVIVRLDWDDPTADLDLFLFDFSYTASAYSKLKQNHGPEVLSFSVLQPNYFWLWVGGLVTGSQYPAPYSLTICGEKFVP